MKKDLSIEEMVQYVLDKDLINENVTIQVYEELVHLAHFLNSLKPHNVLEIGARGGTFQLFNMLSTGTKIAVDIDKTFKNSIHLSMIGEDFHFLCEDSQSFDTFEKVKSLCPEFDFIFIDGWHSINQVLADWEYTNLLTDGGIVGFHDTSCHPGPHNFIKSLDKSKWDVIENCCPQDWGIGFARKK